MTNDDESCDIKFGDNIDESWSEVVLVIWKIANIFYIINGEIIQDITQKRVVNCRAVINYAFFICIFNS